MKKMKNILSIILILFGFSGLGQTVETHVSGEKSAYEGVSYNVVYDLKLTPGFRARASQGENFRANYLDVYVNPESDSSALLSTDITLVFREVAH